MGMNPYDCPRSIRPDVYFGVLFLQGEHGFVVLRDVLEAKQASRLKRSLGFCKSLCMVLQDL